MKRSAVLITCCVLLTDRTTSGQEPITLRFQGRVIDNTGQPIEAAGITIAPHDRYLTADALERPVAKTAADGTFVIEVVASENAGSIPSVLIAVPEKAALGWQVYGEWDAAGSPVDLGDIVLPAGANLKGWVRTADGKPIPGARVVAWDLIRQRTWSLSARQGRASYITTAFTTADGEYLLPCALPQAAELAAVAGKPVSVTIQVADPPAIRDK
jgi:protocatechuate 3,4-dioxygenase beta subunit